MSEKIFKLLIHHGGSFTNGTRGRHYIGGRVTQVCDDLDIDKVSCPEIMSYVKEDLRYQLESITGLYYYKQGNFVLIQDDPTILSIVNELPSGAKLEFYVDHKSFEKHDTLSLEEEMIEIENISGGVNNIADEVALGSQVDDVEIMVNEGMHDVQVEIPPQTFDNLNVDVDFLTDDDDEELRLSRGNVRAFKNKNTFENNGEDYYVISNVFLIRETHLILMLKISENLQSGYSVWVMVLPVTVLLTEKLG